MKVIYADEALADLDGILSFIASNYPSIYDAFQSRLRSVVARIGYWPESAQAERTGLGWIKRLRPSWVSAQLPALTRLFLGCALLEIRRLSTRKLTVCPHTP